MKIDEWVWGKEKILRGDSSAHEFTLKVLEPKKGRIGCLSLQYHNKKSEAWVVIRGLAWALVVIDGQVCTAVMKPGDYVAMDADTIHRLMAVSDDLQILEPSTPDEHASDKSAIKDVVRLHCVHGREVSAARNSTEKALVEKCIEYSEEAIACIEAGKIPPEYNRTFLINLFD